MARVIQCLLAAGTVLLTYLLGKRVTGRAGIGLTAAVRAGEKQEP